MLLYYQPEGFFLPLQISAGGRQAFQPSDEPPCTVAWATWRCGLAPRWRKKSAASRQPNALDQRIAARPASSAMRIGHGAPSEANRTARSLLLVVLIEIILILVVSVIDAMSRRAMGLVYLVVPELAIGAVLGKQLGMGAALDRPAP